MRATPDDTGTPPSLATPIGLGFTFADLYADDGLERIDAAFLADLEASSPALAQELEDARSVPDALTTAAESALITALAPALDAFVGKLFAITPALDDSAARHRALEPLFSCKRLFVQRIACKRHRAAEAETFDGEALIEALTPLLGASPRDEDTFARRVTGWLADEAANAAALDLAARFAAWAAQTQAGHEAFGGGILFHQPPTHDYAHLVPLAAETTEGVTHLALAGEERRERAGFDLTDRGCDLAHGLDEAHYCIYCHHQGNDSCAHGLRERKTGALLTNPLGREMLGCPLGERISEMNEIKAKGLPIGALAIITLDNPLCAGTGHRICNDCMVACIYQKQQHKPVEIPEIETRGLKDVLALPWGFEIYGLLTRWNPLNLQRPLPLPDSGRKVLVVGLGPAGYTLSHHLLNQGHWVLAVDGLKIEPLDPELSGVDALGNAVPFHPIRDINQIRERLGNRVMGGFGGVAEYGITVRWDKNFLTIIRLLLERRRNFSMIGGVRLGGTLTPDDAFALGFDHVALCMGAGKPTIVPMRNGLARGVRQASDFLMGLQLTGAARGDSVANLQLRLPVAVIGGGLTAVDACTEALAYYPVQVEKFLARYETLVAERGEATVRAGWSAEDHEVASEFLDHARQIRAERALAEGEGRPARVLDLLHQWGGASLYYRRGLTDSPAYRNNHEEVAKALEEGITIAEHLSPLEVELDAYGHARALRLRHGQTGAEVSVAARAVIVAAGTVPNTVLARETGAIVLDGKYFRAVDASGQPVSPERRPKPDEPQVLLDARADGTGISFFGDLHPSYAGNVVTAMASAKQGYPVIGALMENRPPPKGDGAALLAAMNATLRPTVHAITRHTPTIVEITLHAPQAARHFRPGQFYRLQNFERQAPRVDGTTLAMEGLALTGAWVDREAGLLSVIVLEMGGSSDLCAHLRLGEPVVLMGPTGSPTEIGAGETVLLAGGGLGNAVLFSIGKAMRAEGCKVLYFAGYKGLADRYRIDDIHAAADTIVWCCDETPGFVPARPGDFTHTGTIVDAMVAYAEGRLGTPPIALSEVDRVIAIGSDRMMRAIAEARHGVLAPHLNSRHVAIGSINSPMQCMMKEICGQCLQPLTDPQTGETRIVFTCFNQDLPLDEVDFPALAQRLGQNSLAEKLTRAWIDRCLRHLGKRGAPPDAPTPQARREPVRVA
ncbi:pyridine nucleotide-disulfide oxidoreductase [Rhodospirillum rubrum]|uniref:FAD-dependent oxidoreductase n=1 Tax=Rhodospirillum rubrum TaxID=1085 RepID=UPI00190420D5|nr:FAD-dependent oxidoreductase [Rhodospirillum rubrum]MBK1664250.1 pyridine nucleotide-disulfide oxidoreductase [Rhodospirillum rubrum]MBK1675332.1 pyridine nucleotide-disulfide oxidoreductase [Rhodospirillum rubrum]